MTLLNSNESLRLQPPIPGGSQRSVNKGAGKKVLGKWYAATNRRSSDGS
jgi:hypothetical protein